MPYWLQAPQEQRDVAFEWQDRLDDVGSPQDTISSSTWTLEPDVGSPSPTLSDETVSGTQTFCLVKDLVPGHVYTVRNVIVTNQGRRHQRTATIRCDYK